MAKAKGLLLEWGLGGICNLRSPSRDMFLNLIEVHAWWSSWRKAYPDGYDPQTLGGQGQQEDSDLGTQQHADNCSPEAAAKSGLF